MRFRHAPAKHGRPDRPIVRRPLGAVLSTVVAVGLAAIDASPMVAADAIVAVGAAWTIAHRGAVALPDHAPDADGRPVPVTGLSGVARLGDDSYAAIMDNGDKLLRFTLRLSRDGKPLAADECRVVTLSEKHDYEDLAVCPDDVARRLRAASGQGGPDDGGPYVFLCEEDTPAIRLASLATGRLLGAMPLPANLRSRRFNKGIESLAVDPGARHLWTANEEALTIDGGTADVGGGTVVRLTRISIDRGAADPAGPVAPADESFQAAYPVEPPHSFARVFAGRPLSGLVALVALGDGTVLAMERSCCPGLPPFANRIFLVDAARAADVSPVERDLAARRESFARKRLLWEGSLGINLEGLCLGPKLGDGSRALVAVADNGGLGTPSQVVTLGLVPPAGFPTSAVLGMTGAIVAVAVLAGRLRRTSVAGRRGTGPPVTSP